MAFDGDGSNADVNGVGWGDKYKFFTRDEPISFQSKWDYTQPNIVPFVRMWVKNPDAEMGIVQTQSWLQHNTGGTWFQDNWGHTSENRVGTNFTPVMPVDWNWPYQLNQYELPFTSKSKRLAWGLMYGAVGQAEYDGYGNENKYSGHPYQSYSVHMVMGRQSANEVLGQVSQVEHLLQAQLTVTKGQVVSQGPGGVGRTDVTTYPKAGYNHIYGAFELRADGGAFSLTLNAAGGSITNPMFIVRGMGGIPNQLTLNGVTLVADQDYFASYDASNQTLWLTLNRVWSGSQILAIGS